MPREVHLEAVLHVFAFLRQKYNSRMAFDPTYLAIDMSDFKDCGWKDYYGKFKEAIPPNYPEERGKEVDLCGYVESNHTGEKNKEVSFWVFHILEHVAKSMVLQQIGYDRYICVWSRVCDHEDFREEYLNDNI